jgi:predicted XRE-type DNA-binding protein
MPKELEMIEIEAGSTNVYEDLGLPDAAEMRVKATLAAKIGEIIKHRHLTQVQAAEILGMPQPKLSGMLRGQFRGISEAKMLECMNRLGRDVEIVVRKPSRSRAIGRTSVVFA